MLVRRVSISDVHSSTLAYTSSMFALVSQIPIYKHIKCQSKVQTFVRNQRRQKAELALKGVFVFRCRSFSWIPSELHDCVKNKAALSSSFSCWFHTNCLACVLHLHWGSDSLDVYIYILSILPLQSSTKIGTSV